MAKRAMAYTQAPARVGAPRRRVSRRRDSAREQPGAGTVGAVAAERDRLCQVLHDDAQQVLASAANALETATVAPELIAAELRELSRRLRTAVLAPGAEEATRLARTFEESLRRDVERAAGDVAVRLLLSMVHEPSPTAAQVIHDVVVEAVANARKHADASSIRVWVSASDTELRAFVADDGSGIPDAFVSRGRPGHIGLASMRLWATRSGGTCEIQRGRKHGTRVLVSIPLLVS